jgi:hypothetical protein
VSKLQAPKNPNYAATVVELKSFTQLAGADRIQGALIFGNHVIVSKEAKAGDIGLFFPVETQLDKEFLGANNLYRKPEHGNVDPEQKGFFEEHGRIKCMKFRGHKSEGLFMPISCLQYIADVDFKASGNPTQFAVKTGDTFDTIGDHTICRKYVPKRNKVGGNGQGKPGHSKARISLQDQIVPNQFRFHTDTENLRRNIHKIQPNDYISISDKFHGTSVVISKVLTIRELSWFERLLQRFGVAIKTEEYGFVYSSRKVVKAVNGVEKHKDHYYSSDIWGVVAREVEDKLPLGYTIYGEIVGYTPEGSPIQGEYTYGCLVGGHRFLLYRVTATNTTGNVIELSWHQMKEFAAKVGIETVPEMWYGKASDLVLMYSEDGWSQDLLKTLEGRWVKDGMCPHNGNKVPAEGVVVRVDRLDHADAFKLKNFKFLERESKSLDKGEVDVETQEAEEVTA